MPTYRWLKDGKEGETWFDTIAEGEEFFAKNPEYTWLPSFTGGAKGTTGIVDPWRAGIGHKPSAEFRSILRDIKKRHPKSDINTFD